MAIPRRINFRDAAAEGRARLKQVRLSSAEIVALATLLAFCVFVVWFHLSKVRPKVVDLDALVVRENVALARLRQANDEKKRFEDERSNSGKIVGSIESFEHLLKYREEGTPQIITEVNRLAVLSGAEASDFAYRLVASETAETQSPTGTAEREDKLNVFTALGIDTTAVGSYANLRRFIQSIEQSPQFIIIEAIVIPGRSRSDGTRSFGVSTRRNTGRPRSRSRPRSGCRPRCCSRSGSSAGCSGSSTC